MLGPVGIRPLTGHIALHGKRLRLRASVQSGLCSSGGHLASLATHSIREHATAYRVTQACIRSMHPVEASARSRLSHCSVNIMAMTDNVSKQGLQTRQGAWSRVLAGRAHNQAQAPRATLPVRKTGCTGLRTNTETIASRPFCAVRDARAGVSDPANLNM